MTQNRTDLTLDFNTASDSLLTPALPGNQPKQYFNASVHSVSELRTQRPGVVEAEGAAAPRDTNRKGSFRSQFKPSEAASTLLHHRYLGTPSIPW